MVQTEGKFTIGEVSELLTNLTELGCGAEHFETCEYLKSLKDIYEQNVARITSAFSKSIKTKTKYLEEVT